MEAVLVGQDSLLVEDGSEELGVVASDVGPVASDVECADQEMVDDVAEGVKVDMADTPHSDGEGGAQGIFVGLKLVSELAHQQDVFESLLWCLGKLPVDWLRC